MMTTLLTPFSSSVSSSPASESSKSEFSSSPSGLAELPDLSLVSVGGVGEEKEVAGRTALGIESGKKFRARVVIRGSEVKFATRD